MIVVPTSDIILLKNPIEIDYMNELTFNSLTDQYNYFHNLEKLECENATYVRKDDVIRFPTRKEDNITFDDVIKFNYCMYKNSAWSNKWFYAFIKDVKYENDGMCLIEIETDVWQTWMFDITFKNSFIEREHVNDDTIGKHTIPEGLETGEYVCSSKQSLYSNSHSIYTCVMCSKVPSAINVNQYVARYNGIYSGTIALLFDSSQDDGLGVSKFIKGMDNEGMMDSITSIFIVPKALCGTPTFNMVTIGGVATYLATLPYSDNETLLTSSGNISKPSNINGYTPKNNKCWTWPFNYFYITNNVGVDAEFRYEDFINNTPSFKTIGSLTPGCSIRCIPLNYKLLSDNNSYNSYNYGITGAKYPICSWSSDVYTNWLTQNGVNLALSGAGSVGSIIGGLALLATGAGATAGIGAIAGGIMGIGRSVAQVYEHSLIPPQARGNQNSGDVTFSANKMDITLYKMTIKYEYIKVIDNYFSMYGYKVNELKLPNITGRTNWNYVKTIGCNIIGDIPQKDLEKIKEIFNNGVTLWHNPLTFLDYSQTNNIVT